MFLVVREWEHECMRTVTGVPALLLISGHLQAALPSSQQNLGMSARQRLDTHFDITKSRSAFTYKA